MKQTTAADAPAKIANLENRVVDVGTRLFNELDERLFDLCNELSGLGREYRAAGGRQKRVIKLAEHFQDALAPDRIQAFAQLVHEAWLAKQRGSQE